MFKFFFTGSITRRIYFVVVFLSAIFLILVLLGMWFLNTLNVITAIIQIERQCTTAINIATIEMYKYKYLDARELTSKLPKISNVAMENYKRYLDAASASLELFGKLDEYIKTKPKEEVVNIIMETYDEIDLKQAKLIVNRFNFFIRHPKFKSLKESALSMNSLLIEYKTSTRDLILIPCAEVTADEIKGRIEKVASLGEDILKKGEKFFSEVSGFSKYMSSVTIKVFLIICLISMVITLIILFFITKPIAKLITVIKDVTLEIGKGNLTQRIKISGSVELVDLADAFNKIIDAMHAIVTQVRNSADKVAASSQEMSSSAHEMNSSTQEICNSVSQVNKGSLDQMERVQEAFEIMEKSAVNLKQVVVSAQTASQAVNLTSERSVLGRAAAKEAADKIGRLTGTVVETTEVIQNLCQMSQQISEITETITSIADQTNLLALNAAIEAARAGEAGKGFAVVAEEVRKLAEGSAEAVRKIGGLITSIQSETNRAVSAIQKSSKEVQEGKIQVFKISEILTEINSATREATVLAQQIAVSGQERVDEVERVVKAINEIAIIAKESVLSTQGVTSSTQQQVASMEEMNASAQELARLALELKDLVGRFKLKDERR